MKTIIYHECEICGRRWNYADSAQECEAKGPADPTRFPRGLIFGDPNDPLYLDITFVVAEVEKSPSNGHLLEAALWAFRDNFAGDSRGLKDLCCAAGFFTLGPKDVPNRQHPTFKRAVAFLKKHKITPWVWDGTKAKKMKK